jgi:hypothetical protein
VTLTAKVGHGVTTTQQDPDEALSARLRDLSLVELDALVAHAKSDLIGAFADDVADALREARTRIAALRAQLGGADPLNVLEATVRQRAADTAVKGGNHAASRLVGQAEAARSLARLADLAAALVPKLFEADRRR